MQMQIIRVGRVLRGSLRNRGGSSGAAEGEFRASRWHPNDVPSDSGVDAWRRGSLPRSQRVPSTRKYMSRRDHRPPFVVPVAAGAKIKRHSSDTC